VDTVIEKIMQLSEGTAALSPRPQVAPPSVAPATRARKGDDDGARDLPIEESGAPEYDAEAPPPREARPALRRTTPAAGRVSEEEVRAALSDPHVAKVVDVFKGRIVDVKRDGKSTR
jgi:hypothetical protein